MNAKALELGMVHTSFHSPNGLPPAPGQLPDLHSTARPSLLLSRYLLLHTDILRYTSVRARTFGTGVRLQTVAMTNHNHLLGRIAGCDGLKTGFTNGAGFCLAATAQRGGHRVIAVIMGSSEAKLARSQDGRAHRKTALRSIPVGSTFNRYTRPAEQPAPVTGTAPVGSPPAVPGTPPATTPIPAGPAAIPAANVPSPITPAPLTPGEKTSDTDPANDGLILRFPSPVTAKKG